MNLRSQTNKHIATDQLGLCSMFAKTAQVILTQENDVLSLTKEVKFTLDNFIKHQGSFKLLNFIEGQVNTDDQSFLENMQFIDPYINVSYLRSINTSLRKDFKKLNINSISGCATTSYCQANPWSLNLTLIEHNNCVSCCLVYMNSIWNKDLVLKFIDLFINKLKIIIQ